MIFKLLEHNIYILGRHNEEHENIVGFFLLSSNDNGTQAIIVS